MAGHSPERAMREFLRRGGRDQRGLDDLAAGSPAAPARPAAAAPASTAPSQEVRELLDHAVLAERKQLARDLDDDARFAEMRIENLPPSTAAAVTELSDYDWRSSEAREDYEQIKDLLGREMLDQRFAGMKQALENATDEDRQRVNEMLERPQRPARGARPRRGHHRAVRATSWTSTASSSRRTPGTSTSCSTRWPSAPRPRSGCATR